MPISILPAKVVFPLLKISTISNPFLPILNFPAAPIFSINQVLFVYVVLELPKYIAGLPAPKLPILTSSTELLAADVLDKLLKVTPVFVVVSFSELAP